MFIVYILSISSPASIFSPLRFTSTFIFTFISTFIFAFVFAFVVPSTSQPADQQQVNRPVGPCRIAPFGSQTQGRYKVRTKIYTDLNQTPARLVPLWSSCGKNISNGFYLLLLLHCSYLLWLLPAGWRVGGCDMQVSARTPPPARSIKNERKKYIIGRLERVEQHCCVQIYFY